MVMCATYTHTQLPLWLRAACRSHWAVQGCVDGAGVQRRADLSLHWTTCDGARGAHHVSKGGKGGGRGVGCVVGTRQCAHQHLAQCSYDLDADPGEMHPLTAQNLSSYGDLVARAAGLREEHLGSMQPKPRQQLGRIPMMHIYATMGCCNFPYCQCCEECDEAGNVPGPYTGSGVSAGGGGGGGGHTPAFEKTMHGKHG